MTDVTVVLATDSVLVLGRAHGVSATATAGGTTLPNARFTYSIADSGVVAFRSDSLVPRRRGQTELVVSLSSSLLPSAPPSDTVRLRVVVAEVVTDSQSVNFASLGDTVTVESEVRDDTGGVVEAAPAWSSSDTSVVRVSQLGRLAARGNGTAEVRAVVDFDTAVVQVTVQQVLDHYSFAQPSYLIDALAASVQVAAQGRDARDNPMTGVAPTYSAAAPSIALVNPATGAATALLNGQTWVLAARGQVADSVPLVVDQRSTVVVIQPQPIPDITSIGDQAQLTARAFDRNGQELQNASAAWFTLSPAIARVSSDGVVTGLGPGTGQVVASLHGRNDTASVTVRNDPASLVVSPDTATATSVGDTLIFSATVRNGRGDIMTGLVPTWRAPGNDTLTVRVLADGRAITRATGFARVIAQATNGVATATDTGFAVSTNQVALIDIAPAFRLLTSLGEVDTLAVTIENARGAGLARTSVTWSSDDDAIARVNALGLVTAVDTGSTWIRATAGFFTDSVQYFVQNVPTSVVITLPARGGVTSGPGLRDTLTAIGQSLALAVEVRNARNAVIPNYPLSWRSTDLSVVDTPLVSNAAVAIGFGTTVVFAVAGSAVDSVRLTVRNLTRLTVDNSVVASPRMGTSVRPFARIQDAVDAADANDTVFVLRGLGSYSETVGLARRLFLLGDSTAFVAGRDPADLPLIAHDTGTAAILAHTTAPQTIRYLAVRHTLDGPAVDADGSDLTVEWVYVNPPGSVSSRVGRGISVRNSPSGTTVRNSRIRSVRGYGIRLENVSGVTIWQDSIIGIDSVAGVEPGSGVYVIGGGNATIESNVIRQAQGPQINVRKATSPVVSQNNLASQNTLVRYDSVQGSPLITNNTFDMRFQPGDDGRNSAQDDRAAVQLFNSAPPPRLFISNNTFQGAASGFLDAIYVVNSAEWFVSGNTFVRARYGIRTQDVGLGYIERNTADSSFFYISSEGNDQLLVFDDTVRNVMSSCISTAYGGSLSITVRNSLFYNCAYSFGPYAIDAGGSGSTSVSVVGSRIEARRRMALGVNAGGAGSVRIDSTEIVLTDSAQSSNYPFDSLAAAVRATWPGSSVTLDGTLIAGFGSHPGLILPSTGTVELRRNTFTRNRIGFSSEGVAPNQNSSVNDVFDNRSAGFFLLGGAASLPNAFWWGDGRGPRSGAVPDATGDSIAGSVTASALVAPRQTGTVASEVRHVRGTGQDAPRATVAPKRLTVRVVDSAGRPVSGVGVTFTVTGGGGNIGGSSSSAVTSNGDGLAEVTFTLGPAAGSNTVTAAGTSGSIGAVTFTLTGT